MSTSVLNLHVVKMWWNKWFFFTAFILWVHYFNHLLWYIYDVSRLGSASSEPLYVWLSNGCGIIARAGNRCCKWIVNFYFGFVPSIQQLRWSHIVHSPSRDSVRQHSMSALQIHPRRRLAIELNIIMILSAADLCNPKLNLIIALYGGNVFGILSDGVLFT